MWFHRHQWRVLSAQPRRQFESYLDKRIGTFTTWSDEGSPVTDVLQRCEDARCGKIRTTTLDGTWTVEEITA